MTCTSWSEPVHVLVTRMPVSIAGLWSLLQTGALATTELSLLPGLDDDLALTGASADLGEAAGELEWAQPHLPVTGAILDVGAAALDDVNGCRTAVTAVIGAALRTTTLLMADPQATAPDVVTLARITPLLISAHARVLGVRP